MRKPLLALSLAASTGFGAIPVASTLAASPSGTPHSGNPASRNTTPPQTPSSGFSSTTRNAVSGAAIVSFAYRYIGYPYSLTGNTPAGFSCIGFASYVYRHLGIPLPGDLGNAYAYAAQVPFSDLLPGDLLYFQDTLWPGLSHVAIYVGNGQFIHAEYYGKGVRVSSFRNDTLDGNYWIQHYMGANRPWSGPVVGAAPPPTGSSKPLPVGNAGLPSTVVSQKLPTGPSSIVTVASLNVRTRPTKKSTVQTVIVQGTSVTVLSRSNGWVKVALPDGTIGWVVAVGIGGNGSTGNSVNQPVAPARQGQIAPTAVRQPTIKSRVNGLRVRSSPSTGSNIVTSVVRGQRMTVIARSGAWVEVRLPNGTTGWVSSAYATGNRAATTAKKTYTNTASRTQPRAKTAVNVRTSPSLKATVATVLLPDGSYRVLGWSNGWAHVQLPNGTIGWVSGTVLGVASATASAANTYANTHPRRKTTAASTGGSVITAGVRVHSSPGIKAPVVTLAARGTHVHVLGYNRGWTLVRLPNGRTGYVLGIYVR